MATSPENIEVCIMHSTKTQPICKTTYSISWIINFFRPTHFTRSKISSLQNCDCSGVEDSRYLRKRRFADIMREMLEKELGIEI